MDKVNHLTVSEYAQSIGKSKQSVYNRVKRGTIPTVTVDEQIYIDVDKIVDEPLINNHNQVNPIKPTTSEPLNNTLIDSHSKEIKSLKKENKKLKKLVDSKNQEIKDLLERIISIEVSQKTELIKLQDQKHDELKLYMDFIKSQSTNILTAAPVKGDENIHEAIIDVDTKKDKKSKTKDKKKDKKKKRS